MISTVDNNIIGGMPGACQGQHLGHIVNNGQQSAVLHASLMPFFVYNFFCYCLFVRPKVGWCQMASDPCVAVCCYCFFYVFWLLSLLLLLFYFAIINV